MTHTDDTPPATGTTDRDAGTSPALRPGPTPGVAYRPDGTRTFLPGNTVTLTHGARSRFVATEADELAAIITDRVPHLTETDAFAVRDLAVAQVKVWRLETWVEKNGELDEHGEVRKATAELRRWMATAEKARARLGFDPVSRFGLGIASLESHRRMRDLGAEAMASPDAIREAAEQARRDAIDIDGGAA